MQFWDRLRWAPVKSWQVDLGGWWYHSPVWRAAATVIAQIFSQFLLELQLKYKHNTKHFDYKSLVKTWENTGIAQTCIRSTSYVLRQIFHCSLNYDQISFKPTMLLHTVQGITMKNMLWEIWSIRYTCLCNLFNNGAITAFKMVKQLLQD